MPEQLAYTIRKNIGHILRVRREQNGWSLRDLAGITKTGHSWLAKVEKGQINIQIDSLIKILESLELQPSELFKSDFPIGDQFYHVKD